MAPVRAWEPFEVEITDFVTPGENELVIKVANSLQNLICATPKASGILGEVRVAAYEVYRRGEESAPATEPFRRFVQLKEIEGPPLGAPESGSAIERAWCGRVTGARVFGCERRKGGTTLKGACFLVVVACVMFVTGGGRRAGGDVEGGPGD